MRQNYKIEPNLKYFKKLTTDIGILQHGNLDKPDPDHGYSIDDCARALICSYQLFENFNDHSVLPLANIYLNYLIKSKIKGGNFHNFLDKNDIFLDEVGSETSTARAIWALGYITSRPDIDIAMTNKAINILKNLPPISKLEHIRSKSYALIGYYYLKDKNKVDFLAQKIVESYNQQKKEDWFQEYFEYANGILPFSLFLAYLLTKNKQYLNVAEKSFLYLDRLTRNKHFACPISHWGYPIGSKVKEVYDQQAIEATDMVMAAKTGFLATRNKFYAESASDWFGWFHGNNIHKIDLINNETGACFDGITKTGVNENKGAESIICYLLAYNVMASQGVLTN